MKLSRYEDSPYEQWQRSRGFGNLEDTGVLWSVTEIDFHDGYLYLSGSMQYDANSNGKLDIVPYADRVKLASMNQE